MDYKISVCGPGHIAFTRRIQFQGAYGFNDLYTKPLNNGPIRRITFGARLREITCSSNGRWLVAVQVVDGHTRLVRVNLETGDITKIFKPNAGAQVGLPRISNNDKLMVATIVDPNLGRDLYLMDTQGTVIKRLTRDKALELNPVFAPGDRDVVYASDRTGIFDIYRLNIESGINSRLTRVVTGATNPIIVPEGQTLFVTTLTATGYDIARTIPLNETEDAPKHPMRVSKSASIRTQVQPTLADEPYLGWSYMWPQNWAPTLRSPQRQTSRAISALILKYQTRWHITR